MNTKSIFDGNVFDEHVVTTNFVVAIVRYRNTNTRNLNRLPSNQEKRPEE